MDEPMGLEKGARTDSQDADCIEVCLRRPPNPSRNSGTYRGKSPIKEEPPKTPKAMATDPSSAHQGARLATRKSHWDLEDPYVLNTDTNSRGHQKTIPSPKPRNLLDFPPKCLINFLMRPYPQMETEFQ